MLKTNEYTTALLPRLQSRPKLTLVHHDSPPTGQIRPTYGQTYAQTVQQGQHCGESTQQMQPPHQSPVALSVPTPPAQEIEEIK